MRLTFPRIVRNEAARLARDDGGVAVMFVLGAFLFLYTACLGVWAVGSQIRERAALQNACDAAAYSASVAQADGLSRMAVVNRAMSWSYIQMTKMQMDYIAQRWLELTLQRFEEDEKCIVRTKLIRMFSKEAGYHNFESDWRKLQPLAWWSENIGYAIPPYVIQLTFGFNCRDDTHNDSNPAKQNERPKPNAAYIGFKHTGDGWQDSNSLENHPKVGHVRLNNPTHDTKLPLYLPVTPDDRRGADTLDSSPTPSLTEMVEGLQKIYGAKGASLADRIRAMRNAIISCNALLPAINAKMAESIRESAVRTLRENLPRDDDGLLDEDLLRDIEWTVSGGVSAAPVQYSAGITSNGVASTSYFSGLRNVEEDEILFLNMADGLPRATGGNTVGAGHRHDVRLVDYFADEADKNNGTTLPSTAGVAAGLDQWFIRCDPAETAISNQKSITRRFAGAEGGIVRGYKNANYYEGQSGGSLLQHALDVGEGVHRANYVFDSVQDMSEWTVSSMEQAKNRYMDNIFSLVKQQLDEVPSDKINPGSKPKWYHFRKRLKYEAKKAVKNGLKENVDDYWKNLTGSLDEHIFHPLEAVVKHFIDNLIDLDIEPSCNNRRERFIDKCANVRDTTGLVSEYEWASAYWFCFWFKAITVAGTYKGEYHIPVPVAALHGGVKLKNQSLKHAPLYGDTSLVRTDSYGHGFFCPWYHDELREFKGKPRGKSRDDYRSTFISIDGDVPASCSHAGIFGRRSNFLLKGFVRIYGDDKAVVDDLYAGVPAQPWVLNERFFNGGGSIVVGLAKRQRNPFERLVDSFAAPGLHSAFSPPPDSGDLLAEPEGDGASNRRFVALAAARAGYAPRTGSGVAGAGGADSVNIPARSAPRRYELRWDDVTNRRLGKYQHPTLPDASKLGPYRDMLERDGRIGCVCATPNTTERLKHQWNLCQTDWDGLLLPLREAHARASGYDSAPTTSGGSGRDNDRTTWTFSTDGGALDSVNATVGSLLYGHAVWRPLDPTNDTVRATSEVMPLPRAEGAGTPVDLFRLRRIL